MTGSCSCNKVEPRIKHALKMFHAMTDGIDEIIYIIDPSTHEILFANEKAMEVFGKDVQDKKCYEIFHNIEKPCSSCAPREKHETSCTKEIYYSKGERYFKCTGKSIQWPDGKFVHFGIAVDITEQKRMQNALKDSEQRYRNIVNNAPDVIYSISKDGTIASINPAFERITGWSREEWIGKTFEKLIHPEDLPLALETFQRVLRGESLPPYELRVLAKSGEYLVGEFTSVPQFENGNIVGEVGIVRDVTDRKRMEELLKEREELFRSIVENSHECILMVDDAFRVIYVNDEVQRLIGCPKTKVLGNDFRNYVDRDSLPLVVKRYLLRQQGKKVPLEYEFKIVRENGEKRDVKLRATVIRDTYGKTRTIAQLLDITEQKRMEMERQRFAERLSALNLYGKKLNMTESMEEIYKLTLDAMEKTLGFEYASFFMAEGNMLRLKAHRKYPKKLRVELPLDGQKGITVKAATMGKTVYVSDIAKERSYVAGGVKGMRSELAVPIKVQNKVLGVLNVESRQVAAFNVKDRELLEILASHAATAISHLKKREKLFALNIYGRKLNNAKDIETISKLTLDAMQKILGYKYVDIFLVKGKKLDLIGSRGLKYTPKLSLPLDGEKGITVRAAKKGKAVYVSNVKKEKAYVGAGVKGVLSELAVPIKLGGTVLGVLNVESERHAAFDEEDREFLEILASHIAIALSNLRRQERLAKLSKRLEHLMKASTKIMHMEDTRKRLKIVAKAIQKFGWGRVVISLRDENLEGIELVTAGLTEEEIKLLQERKAPGHIWQERLGPKFERYKIGTFYYLPWSDPWIREYVHGVPPEQPPNNAKTYAGVPSKVSPQETFDWHPQDMLYAPLLTPTGRIVGILSIDDPEDGRRPTKETLAPLELFLHQAAIIIENTQLMESLNEARKKLEEYAEQLERKVEERTLELKKSQEQLLKAQRFAVIGELAGMVGHDLRNPLTSIAGAQYYLKKQLFNKIDGKIMEMLELIEKNIAYSNKIINDLLDYSREIELELIETTPSALVKDALTHVEIPSNVKVVNLTKNETKLRVDIDKIRRAFLNIIRNAIEAMPKGGTLEIKSQKANDDVEFTFTDTGVGMSKKTLKNLWTPLFTTKAKGMGFGLPICKRFIEAHGGAISVKSAPRKGTTFTITLPIQPKTVYGGEKIWVKQLESSSLTTTKT